MVCRITKYLFVFWIVFYVWVLGSIAQRDWSAYNGAFVRCGGDLLCLGAIEDYHSQEIYEYDS